MEEGWIRRKCEGERDGWRYGVDDMRKEKRVHMG